MNTVGIVSLGCSKNRVDTEQLLGYLAETGFVITPDVEFAQTIIINTCGFITAAKEESINAILEMAQYKQTEFGTCKLLVVCGCLSERYDDELTDALPEVDIFWGVKNREGLVHEIMRKLDLEKPASALMGQRILSTPGYSAYLRIADGCDNNCTYCAIPLIRGGRRSVPMEELILEAKQLARAGVKEITLIAQDTSAYGMDLYGKPMLKELLEKIAAIAGFVWVRVLYAYPNTVSEELIDSIVANKKIVNYIDMPIQHISPEILKAMNRHGTAEHIRHMTDYIRKTQALDNQKFILRTTVMLGFPGETQADFETLGTFLREHPFDRLGAFAFSAEDETAAAEMSNQLDESVKQARMDSILRMQQDLSRSFNLARVGQEYDILIERKEGDAAYGRSYAEAPEVDGFVRVENVPGTVEAGDFIRARIQSADVYDLMAVYTGASDIDNNL